MGQWRTRHLMTQKHLDIGEWQHLSLGQEVEREEEEGCKARFH